MGTSPGAAECTRESTHLDVPGGAITIVESEPATLPRRHRRTTPDQDVHYNKRLKAPVKRYPAVESHDVCTSLPVRPTEQQDAGRVRRGHRIADLLREEIRAANGSRGSTVQSFRACRSDAGLDEHRRNAIQVLVTENRVYTVTSRGTIVRKRSPGTTRITGRDLPTPGALRTPQKQLGVRTAPPHRRAIRSDLIAVTTGGGGQVSQYSASYPCACESVGHCLRWVCRPLPIHRRQVGHLDHLRVAATRNQDAPARWELRRADVTQQLSFVFGRTHQQRVDR